MIKYVMEQPVMCANLFRFWKDFTRNWGLGKKHTTDDQLFTVETVSCLGACGLAPAVMVNDEVHPKMTPEKMNELIKKLREEEE